MLLFNGVYEDGFQKGFIFQYIICCYSTNTILFNFIKSRPFQYIICCYSTINKASLPRTFPNFNTSYVIIQLFRQSSLPLFFNTSYVIIQPPNSLFSILFHNNFNTSYVIIQPTKNCHSCILLIYINHDLKPFSNILPTIPLKISYS